MDAQASALSAVPRSILPRLIRGHRRCRHSHHRDTAVDAVVGADDAHTEAGAAAGVADVHEGAALRVHMPPHQPLRCWTSRIGGPWELVDGAEHCVGVDAGADVEREKGYAVVALPGVVVRMHRASNRHVIHEIRDGHGEQLPLVAVAVVPMLLLMAAHDVADVHSAQSCVAVGLAANLAHLQGFLLDCQPRQRQMEYPVVPSQPDIQATNLSVYQNVSIKENLRLPQPILRIW